MLINVVAGVTTTLDLVLAWTYVALRFIHTWVHLTSNVVLLRFRIFVISTLVLAILWGSTIAGLILK